MTLAVLPRQREITPRIFQSLCEKHDHKKKEQRRSAAKYGGYMSNGREGMIKRLWSLFFVNSSEGNWKRKTRDMRFGGKIIGAKIKWQKKHPPECICSIFAQCAT